MTTVALDARQDELRSTLDVKTLSIDDHVLLEDKRVDLTKARKADDAILMVDGAPVSPDLRKALKDLLDLRRPSHAALTRLASLRGSVS